MAGQTDTNSYQRGVELAEVGHYEAALNCMREHLRGDPDDAQALNDTGAILHCLGRSAEAIEYLRKAYRLRTESGEIIWNLVEAYLAAGKASEAALLFQAMERAGVLNIEVMNRTATMLLDQGKNGEAVEVLLRSFRLWPDQEVLTPILEVIRSKRPKIALFRTGSGDDAALADAWAFVEQRFMVEYYRDHVEDGIEGLFEWSDIAWFDGGGEIVVEASRLPRSGKTIVSLRPSDVRGDWVRDVWWERVDIVVQIGTSAVEETLLEKVPDLRTRTRLVVIPNGMNLARYTFRERPRGKHLACMGRLSMEANPAFLLQCMQKLHYIDGGYRLFFAGRFENPVLEQYVRHMVQTLGLSDAVSFEGYPNDLHAWLADKHFVVSSGIGEGQVESLVAGMACGLKPVVHNFPEAERLFPSECLFNIAEAFCELVVGQDYDPAGYRRFVEERYPIAEQLKQINRILMQLESELSWQAPVPAGGDFDGGADGFAQRAVSEATSPANAVNFQS
jgi:glycosyltransferase involved in cell wall biosynthesis